jgi:adenosylcobinamide-GDP ribazoletransferase
MMLSDFIAAVRYLTILPLSARAAGRPASSLPWFPVVGLLLGGVLYFAAVRTGGNWPGGTAFLLVALGAVATRVCHLAGLARCADGFGAGQTHARALAAMGEPHVGPFGVCSIVLVTIAKWIAMEQLITLDRMSWIVIACGISRAMQVELAASVPHVRDDGPASALVRDAEPVHRVAALLVAFAAAAVLGGWAGVGMFVVAWIACRVFGAYCRRKVGGITGDLLDACSEGVETLVLFLPGLY